jgi:hypothetical protein
MGDRRNSTIYSWTCSRRCMVYSTLCPWETNPRLFGLADYWANCHEMANKISVPPFLLELIPMELCCRNNLRVCCSCKLKYRSETNFSNWIKLGEDGDLIQSTKNKVHDHRSNPLGSVIVKNFITTSSRKLCNVVKL